MRELPPARFRTLLGLAAALAGVHLTAIALAPDTMRAGRPFPIRLPADSTVVQEFYSTARDLSALRFSATLDGAAAGRLDATLFEVRGAGERLVRRLSLDPAAGVPCCTFSFTPLENSRGRRYRLVFRRGPDGASAPSTLHAAAAREEGDLQLNGHRQPANLLLDATPGTTLMRGKPRADRRLVVFWFILIDMLAAYVLYGVYCVARRERHVTSSSPRP